jgi:hypothetical protein
VSCCSLDAESCAREASCLRGFYDGDVVEVSVNRSGGVMALDFPSFSAFLASFSAAAVASLTALAVVLMASLKALFVAFLSSFVLWLRILFPSFSGSNAMSTSLTSSGTTTLSDTNLTPLGSALSQEVFTSSSSTGQIVLLHSMYQQPALRCGTNQVRI